MAPLRRARARHRPATRQAGEQRRAATKLRIITCNTQGNKPAIAKSCAARLLGQGADVIFTTCDVDYAAPVVQESINAGKLTIATVHRHRPDGPEALRSEGTARVLVRQRRAGRGLGDGRVRLEARLARRVARDRHGHRLLPQRRPGVRGPLAAARRARSSRRRAYQSAGGIPASWQNVVTRLNAKEADVIVTSTAPPFGAQVPIMNGLRTLGNNTPILNSWAGDGNYWYTQNPKVSNYYYVTFASAFGDDPVAAVKALAEAQRQGDREGGEHRRLRHRPGGDRRARSSRSGARAARRTAPRSPRRWRSSGTCPRCPAA